MVYITDSRHESDVHGKYTNQAFHDIFVVLPEGLFYHVPTV